MARDALHEWLVATFGLVPEPADNQVSRTYFLGEVQWHPQRSTRVLRVLFDACGQPARIQLCASSDNNNAVMIAGPFSAGALTERVVQEIKRVGARRGACGAA